MAGEITSRKENMVQSREYFAFQLSSIPEAEAEAEYAYYARKNYKKLCVKTNTMHMTF